MTTTAMCSVCAERPIRARTVCATCYARLARNGGLPPSSRIPLPAVCTVDGCFDAPRAKGLCGRHYQQAKKHGTVNPHADTCAWDGCAAAVTTATYCQKHRQKAQRDEAREAEGRDFGKRAYRECAADHCSRTVTTAVYCRKHARRLARTGSTRLRNMNAGAPLWLSVVVKRDPVPGTCWLWQGHIDKGGYGRVRSPNGNSRVAHRVAYEQFVGPVPDGLELDHLCNNRACVNTAHLEPVTHAENMRRARERREAM